MSPRYVSTRKQYCEETRLDQLLSSPTLTWWAGQSPHEALQCQMHASMGSPQTAGAQLSRCRATCMPW